MGCSPFNSTGAGLTDELLGNAYKIVLEVQQNLAMLGQVADAVPVLEASLVPTFATAAELGSLAHAVNTTNKFKGKLAVNTTDNKLYYAVLGGAADGWRSADGVTLITPA